MSVMVRRSRQLYADPVTDLMTGYVDHLVLGAATYQTDYQVLIRVYRGYGQNAGNAVYIPSSECRSDFSDIRFADTAGRILPYFVGAVGSNYADFWVLLSQIPTTGATMRLLFGGGAVASGSNIATTFPLLSDDFGGDAIDATKWDVSGSAQTVANSQLTVTYSSGMSKAGTKSTFGNGYCAVFSAAISRDYTAQASWTALNGGTFTGIYANYPTAGHYKSIADSDGNMTAYTQVDLGTAYTGTHIWEIARRSSATAQFWIDGTSVATHTQYVSESALPFRFLAQTSGSSIVCDWIGIRKHVSPEPSHGWWGSLEDL